MEEFQEYPKAMYRDGVYVEVKDSAEERAKADEGHTDWHTDYAKMHGAAAAGLEGEAAPELTRDQLKAKATELGLTFPGNISNAKLVELIAAQDGA